MKNKKIKIVSLVLCILLCVSSISFFSASATEQTYKLLFVADESSYNTFLNELANPMVIVDKSRLDYYISSGIDVSNSIVADFDLFDYTLITDVAEISLNNYKAIVLPIDDDETEAIARSAYNQGILVYLYGQLTINDYKEALSLNQFTLSADIYNSYEVKCDTVEQGFDVTFENTEIYNVICYSSNTLLCKFGNSAKEVNYLVAALNNCIETRNVGRTRATIVKSEFDFTTYWGTNNQYASHLDYTLYREMDESDDVYDYFGVKTRTWVDTNGAEVSGIMTKYDIPFTRDDLLETGPDSQNSIGTLSVSVGFGNDGLTGSIGFTVDLSDQRPRIERTEDYTNDTVEWVMTPRILFPKSINDANLFCAATWASTGKYAGINVSYQGVVNIGSGGQYQISSGYTEIPIRFSYSD